MSSVLSDQSARDLIAGELDTSLGIEAGAGTGKTTVLVERVVNVLAAGRVTVDQLAVITFTEKAAAELSTRIRDALERRAQSAPATERERVLVAARDLYRCHIETIHSFAASLLRERPVEAGLDPLFEVLNGLAGTLSFDAAYERFEHELLAQRSPELDRALRRGFSLLELRETAELLNTYRYLLPLQMPANLDGDLDDHLHAFARIRDALRELFARCDPGDDTAVPLLEGIIEWVDRLQAMPRPAEQEFTLLFRDPAKTKLNCGVKANWGEERPVVKALQEQYRAQCEQACLGLRTDALLGLLPAIEQFVINYERERRRAGQPDFDDLLFWAAELLRMSPAARNYFRERFRVVMIDEFQDTDPVQAELALLLTSDAEPEADWRELRPGPGRLTVVGDPKQSIYRFRRADVAVYEQVRGDALSGGHARISTNFRSNPQLLEALNTVFDAMLVAAPGVQPANVRLIAPPTAQAARRAPVVVAAGEMDALSANELRGAEAAAIAGLLYRARTESWEVRGRSDDLWRPCRWGDMAILVPARTGIERYEEALARAGVPYRHEGSRDFYERQEVRDLIWVLSAIDDPTDRLATLGALRSSAFGIDEDDLVIHVAETRNLSYRAPASGRCASVDEAMRELRQLHHARLNLSLAETVRRVVQETHLVEFAMTREDGGQGAANLLAIVDRARLFGAAGGGGLRAFIRYLRASMQETQVEMDATVAEETDDVVRIMTAHGAKGLEYPIVALANWSYDAKNHAVPMPREADHLLHFRVGANSAGRSGHFVTPGFDDAQADEAAHLVAERRRLLYVAATRARDFLLVPRVSSRPAAKGLLGDFVRALPVGDELVQEYRLDELTAPAVEPVIPDRVEAGSVADAVERRGVWRGETKALKAVASAERQIVIASSRERPQGPLAAEIATFDAALVLSHGPPIPLGDAVHMVMERITLPAAEDLEQIAEDVCLEGDIADDLDDIIAMCRACLRAPSVQSALNAEIHWREVPFTIPDPSPAGPADAGTALIDGRVDFVYRDGEELVVIDYKTDTGVTPETAADHARAHHGGQGDVYRDALSRATGLTVRDVVFIYCKAGVEVRLRPESAVAVAL